ncbi:hypothetical protein KUTeg_017131 [Tegillarca granosa]|uniref:FZ domain-containing protein n=1 Tax=Tegillarca granosa TaxID=220873 RepID=A0ABQ9EQE7_TEGGR|nr:hypothetical protein KUTeg_017131 [Tegillarca granosa]
MNMKRCNEQLDFTRPQGECLPYNGTVCSSLLANNFVYYNKSYPDAYDEQEKMAEELLSAILDQGADSRCQDSARKIICHHAFPSCDEDSEIPKPLQMCK